jgi:excisionase family DNA binding protein
MEGLSRGLWTRGVWALKGDENVLQRGQTVPGVRGSVVEALTVSIPLDPFFSLRALAAYAGLSVRKLRDCLDDPLHPLPYYRVGGKILVRRSEFDAWISRYRRVTDASVDQIVAAVMAELN